MARCTQCGADMPEHYAICANCGAPIMQAQNPIPPNYDPYGYAAYPPPVQQRVITSAGGWFGWIMLCTFLPIIGTIIMLVSTKDETAKNYAKLTIIIQIIAAFILFA